MLDPVADFVVRFFSPSIDEMVYFVKDHQSYVAALDQRDQLVGSFDLVTTVPERGAQSLKQMASQHLDGAAGRNLGVENWYFGKSCMFYARMMAAVPSKQRALANTSVAQYKNAFRFDPGVIGVQQIIESSVDVVDMGKLPETPAQGTGD